VLKAAGLHPEIDDRRDPSSILDLYCGTGTISLCLAPYAESVVGVERQRDAVEDARRNARHNDLGNVRFLEGDVGDVLGQEGEWAGKDFDLVVVDPPRGGLQENAMEQLVELEPDDLVYVSCNPDSLADNVVELRDRLGYRVRGIQPIDMFPQTDHIEAVTRLTRRSD
jgi:23S rRNA (uracil1939-C5)-methyltransferase